ncbi:hypothetical protein Rhopal_001683-T1 [Rhodotorula paludigena]|uniref:Uncharacterized protein n=1 Tax=Rhodotorula paludigena TaxID=86838 RepID=A0AAV5GI02_9BASI|nr:hypothetical protein Rhopal_001683-T1 [Rhodotorula paludigena]
MHLPHFKRLRRWRRSGGRESETARRAEPAAALSGACNGDEAPPSELVVRLDALLSPPSPHLSRHSIVLPNTVEFDATPLPVYRFGEARPRSPSPTLSAGDAYSDFLASLSRDSNLPLAPLSPAPPLHPLHQPRRPSHPYSVNSEATTLCGGGGRGDTRCELVGNDSASPVGTASDWSDASDCSQSDGEEDDAPSFRCQTAAAVERRWADE